MGFRRKRSGGGGGGGGGKSGQWMGFMAIIMGIVALIINLIMFNVGIGALDDAYTAAATYTEQIGLLDIMGIWGMVIFVSLMAAGIAQIAAAAYGSYKHLAGKM